MILSADETIDVSPTELVNLSLIHIENVSEDTEVSLFDSTVIEGDGTQFTINLTESQRVRAIEISATPGGDGTGSLLSVEVGFVQDIGTNLNFARAGLAVSEAADVILPNVAAVNIDYNEGIVAITADETLDVTPTSNVNLSNFFIGDMLFTRNINLLGANVINGNDAYTFQIKLTETQRANALRLSSVPGGDGGEVVMQVDNSAVKDIAGNPNPFVTNGLIAIEVPDISQPFAESAEIFYGTGLLIVKANETLDLSPANANVKRDQFYLSSSNTSFQTSLIGASIVEGDSLYMTLRLTESQRVFGLLTSATTGGDGSPVYLHIAAASYIDVGQNNNTVDISVPIIEHADLVRPNVTKAHIDLDNGTIVFEITETADITPALETTTLANMRLVNSTTPDDFVGLRGAVHIVERDSINLTIYLSEAQRVRAIQISSMPGGDGKSMTLDIDSDAITDLANNTNLAAKNLDVFETPDLTAPIVIQADINYSTGVLSIKGSETIDAIPTSLVNLSRFEIKENETMPSLYRFEGLLGRANVTSAESQTIVFTLAEQQRVAALKISGVQGGDNSAIYLDALLGAISDIGRNRNNDNLNIIVTESPDVVVPIVQNAELNYSTGLLKLTASEYMDFIPKSNVDLSKIFISNITGDNRISLVGAKVHEVDGYTCTITLTELQRSLAIAISGTNGGDGSAAFLDVYSGGIRDHGQNFNENNLGLSIVEAADIVPPTIELGSINYGTGLVTIRASETLDVTPHDKVNFDKFFLSNIAGDHRVSLANSKIISIDLPAINFTIPEIARVKAIAISGTPGGDMKAVVLDVQYDALKDIAQNPNTAANNVSVIETPDTIRPQIVNVSLNYSTGVLIVETDETIDTTDSAQVNLSRMFLSNAFNSRDISLASASVIAQDDLAITIIIPPVDRANAIALSGTSGGDNDRLRLDILGSAFHDIGLNDVVESLFVNIHEAADIVPPKILHANLSYSTGTLVITSDEVLDFTASTQVNLSNFFLSNNVEDKFLPITKASIVESDGLHVTLILSERERVNAIAISESTLRGGDGDAVLLDLLKNAVQDVAYNGNLKQTSIFVHEVPDLIVPNITNGTLDYSQGILTLQATEIVDSTPGYMVVLPLILLVNNTGDPVLSLTGGTVTASDE